VNLGKRPDVLFPRRGTKGNSGPALHGSRVPLPKEGINLQGKARCLRGSLGGIYDGSLEGRCLVARLCSGS
jgi:hypothetical protein